MCMLARMKLSEYTIKTQVCHPPLDARQDSKPAVIKIIGCVITT